MFKKLSLLALMSFSFISAEDIVSTENTESVEAGVEAVAPQIRYMTQEEVNVVLAAMSEEEKAELQECINAIVGEYQTIMSSEVAKAMLEKARGIITKYNAELVGTFVLQFATQA